MPGERSCQRPTATTPAMSLRGGRPCAGRGGGIRPRGGDRMRPARPGPGQEPAVGGREARRVRHRAGPGAGAHVLLHPSAIERFTAHAPGLSGPALPGARCARTCGSSPGGWCRTWTRRTRRCPASGPRLPILPPRSAATWRSPMPSPRRRGGCAPPPWSASAPGPADLLDLRNVRGTDIGRRCGGVIVTVRGGRAPRAVPGAGPLPRPAPGGPRSPPGPRCCSPAAPARHGTTSATR